MNFILKYLDTIVPLLLIVIAVLYFIMSKQRLVIIDKTILVFFGGQVLINSISGIMEYYSINNMGMYSLNIFLFAIIFTVYFYHDLNRAGARKMVFAGFILFVLFFIFNLLFIETLNSFNSYSYAFAALLIVVYSLVGLRQLLNFSPDYDLLRLKNFWFAAGILLYFGSSFFIFISYNYLSKVLGNDVSILWKIHNLFLAVSCVVFLKAIMSKEWIPK